MTAAPSAAASPHSIPPAPSAPLPSSLETGFSALYNLKFDRAHAEFERWGREHPEDPMGPASRASSYLFQELNRLGVLEAEFLKNDARLSQQAGGTPDPRLRTAFYNEVRSAETRAQTILERDPRHQDSLLALTIIYGTQADYLNLVEKRPWASLSLFKKSNKHAQALLRINPQAYDAWTASGFTEYLVGSLPFYVRWAVRFDSVEGKKQRAIEQLQLAATRGRYLRPYAKILLAVLYLREKRPADTARLLAELKAEFPENLLFASELARLNGRNKTQ